MTITLSLIQILLCLLLTLLSLYQYRFQNTQKVNLVVNSDVTSLRVMRQQATKTDVLVILRIMCCISVGVGFIQDGSNTLRTTRFRDVDLPFATSSFSDL